MNIILTGFKASGKTTAARALAVRMKKKFLDTDDRIRRIYSVRFQEHHDISTIYRALGEREFRALEHTAVCSLLWENNSVVATGGGTPVESANIPILKATGVCVFLDAQKSLLQERLVHSGSALLQEHQFDTLYTTRYQSYLNTADIVVPIHESIPPVELAEHLYTCISEYTHGK